MVACAVDNGIGSYRREAGQLSRLYRFCQAPRTVPRCVGRTEPDLDLIKQVEQVTTSDLEGPGLALRRNSKRGDHTRGRSPRISDLAITGLAVIWLQKQPGMAEDDHLRSGRAVAKALRHAARQTESTIGP